MRYISGIKTLNSSLNIIIAFLIRFCEKVCNNIIDIKYNFKLKERLSLNNYSAFESSTYLYD